MIKRIFFLIVVVLCIGGIFTWHDNECRIHADKNIVGNGISVSIICKERMNDASSVYS